MDNSLSSNTIGNYTAELPDAIMQRIIKIDEFDIFNLGLSDEKIYKH